jgi:hypothetical protein
MARSVARRPTERYTMGVRQRWHDWVIAIALVGLGVTGVMAIWGNEIRDLIRGEKKHAQQQSSDEPAPQAPGNAAGPF